MEVDSCLLLVTMDHTWLLECKPLKAAGADTSRGRREANVLQYRMKRSSLQEFVPTLLPSPSREMCK